MTLMERRVMSRVGTLKTLERDIEEEIGATPLEAIEQDQPLAKVIV